MRAAVGFRIWILVLIRKHHPALAIAFEAGQYQGSPQGAGQVFLSCFEFSLPTTKKRFLTFHKQLRFCIGIRFRPIGVRHIMHSLRREARFSWDFSLM